MTRAVPFDDFAALAAVAAEGFTPWGGTVTVGSNAAAEFARITGAAGLAGAMLPGSLILSLVPRIMPPRGWALVGYSGALNLGCPHIRYPAAAGIGTALEGRSRLASARAHQRGTLVTLEFEVRAAGTESLCLMAHNELLYLVGTQR